MAASQRQLQIHIYLTNSQLNIFYISYCDVMLKRNEFLWILVGKGFREKVEAQKISFKFHSKTVI